MSNTAEFIKHLNELEVRCVIDDFHNYELGIDFDSYKSHSSYGLFKSLEFICKCVRDHDYETALRANLSDLSLEVTVSRGTSNSVPFQCVFECDDPDDKLLTHIKQLILLFLGVSALQLFVRANVSGPAISEEYLCSNFLSDDVFTHNDALAFLSKNGEWPFQTVVQPQLLCLSYLLFSSSGTIDSCMTNKWWLLRCLMIQQQVLPERIASLHDRIGSLFSGIVEMKWMNDRVFSSAQAVFYVECAQMYLYYHEVARAQRLITSAQNVIGLGIELSGAYGKRTQFQQKAVAQLIVKLERNPERFRSTMEYNESVAFPCDYHLQDDTLLNKVSFIDKDEIRVEYLSPEEQLVLLGYCCFVKKSAAFGVLDQEEVIAYVNCLLEQPKIWSIYLRSLVLRCTTEKGSSRRAERALMQLETLLESIRNEVPPFATRSLFLYATSFPMLWTLEKELADMWLSMGRPKSALPIYERLQLWEDIVFCNQQLGRTSQAEAVIRSQLLLKETPLLWCLLGDVTEDPDMYMMADRLAEGKNARCQRSLGYYYYTRKNYQESLPFLQRSLEINCLQSKVWFSLGFAASKCDDFLLAAKAYRQVVLLDADNFEAWNNLSSAYIHSHQKERAWRSLQEALKCNYEEWRVWENFLLVSVDIGAFDDVIRAWHRLLDIKGKYKDSEVLRILVNAINDNLPSFNSCPASRSKQRAMQLLGRLSSMIPNDYNIWECYSLLHCPMIIVDVDVQTLERAVFFQQKALSCCTKIDRWTSNFEQCGLVLRICIRFLELSSHYIHLLDSNLRAQQKLSTRLSAQSVVTRAEKHIEDFGSSELAESLVLLKNSLIEIAAI